jgi:hypothetical protein
MELKEAAIKAIEDATKVATHSFRKHALQHGWDSDVVAHTHVKYENGKFGVHTHPDYQDRAFVHEYGTENVPPTAAIRKFFNRSENTEMPLREALNHHAGGKK